MAIALKVEIEDSIKKYGIFLDEESAASTLEHEVQDLFYYVRLKKYHNQGSAAQEWIQCIAVCSRALEQFYKVKIFD